jgi:hypothetical protein
MVTFLTMTLPIPFFRAQPQPEVPAIVRVVSDRDVQWNRPVFKAPPLNVELPFADGPDFGDTVVRYRVAR